MAVLPFRQGRCDEQTVSAHQGGNMRVPRSLLTLLCFALFAVSAFASHDTEETTVVVELPFDPLPEFADTQRYWGTHQGAGYRVEVPASWNGSLVMIAHGYAGE